MSAVDYEALAAAAGSGSESGGLSVLWRLSGRRDLDANVVRLQPGATVPPHVEPHLDVLLVVLDGSGTASAESEHRLAAGSVLWLTRGTRRSLAAGPDGLGYLTVHRKRPGMSIGRAPSTEARGRSAGSEGAVG